MGYNPLGSQRVGHDRVINIHILVKMNSTIKL